MASPRAAPTFCIPPREFVAVEHPMVIKNIDSGLKTFGTGTPLVRLFNTNREERCLPIYLRPVDRACAPILSYNNPTSNVLLKITVPKRTGRKRKRGSNEPYAPEAIEGLPEQEEPPSLRSHSRLDNPQELLRTLKDNIGKYQVEAVGSINQTHRYRGLADFHYSTSHGEFMTKFQKHILSGKLEDLKSFELDPSKGVKKNDEIIPPPTMTDKIIPFNWGYHQNPTMKMTTDKATGKKTLVNKSNGSKLITSYLHQNVQIIPSGPPPLPIPDPILQRVIEALGVLLEERPVWSRRALMNSIPTSTPGIYLLKTAIQYVGYLFRGGPFRDLIVKYGVDPRTDPKHRVYQALVFKIMDMYAATGEAPQNAPWNNAKLRFSQSWSNDPTSHIFDGQSLGVDGKIWQVCDITDPLLARLLKDGPVREEFDNLGDGWYCNGTYAKVRRIMRYKVTALSLGKVLLDTDFKKTLAMPDIVEGRNRAIAPRPHIKFVGGEVVRWISRRTVHRGSGSRITKSSDAKAIPVSGDGKLEGASKVGVDGSTFEPGLAPDGDVMMSGARVDDNEDKPASDAGEDGLGREQEEEDMEDDEDEDEDDSNLDPEEEGDSDEGEETLRDGDDWGSESGRE